MKNRAALTGGTASRRLQICTKSMLLVNVDEYEP